MSRYKKAQRNEVELTEIDGIKAIVRPTRDEVFEAINIFKDIQKNKDTDLSLLRKYLGDLLYNSLFVWEDNKRTTKKEEGSEDISAGDIDDFVVNNIFSVWMEVLFALDIIDKEKFEELQAEAKKKEEEAEKEAKESPKL